MKMICPMTMIAEMTQEIYGFVLGPHMLQDWCEEEAQKYVAQTLLPVPASSASVHRRHTNQVAIPLTIKTKAPIVDWKSHNRIGFPRPRKLGLGIAQKA